jgi:hypothetical protein
MSFENITNNPMIEMANLKKKPNIFSTENKDKIFEILKINKSNLFTKQNINTLIKMVSNKNKPKMKILLKNIEKIKNNGLNKKNKNIVNELLKIKELIVREKERHIQLLEKLNKNRGFNINENNVNTAFTRTCLQNAEIVVYRKEEWFKVLMHESFHNFALDFSDMDTSNCHAKILSIFPVNSKVNLFEAYTEFWARIMNVLFCSYFNCKNKNDLNEFLINTEYFINFESNYSFFQLIKVLDFMNIEYKNLYENTDVSANLRATLYKEDTNVLSYYVITSILIYNYQSFLYWCKTNNTSMLQFKKTLANQKRFCDFIEAKYNTPKILLSIDCAETFFKKITNPNNKNNNKKNNDKDKIHDLQFLTNNLRMTICELG